MRDQFNNDLIKKESTIYPHDSMSNHDPFDDIGRKSAYSTFNNENKLFKSFYSARNDAQMKKEELNVQNNIPLMADEDYLKNTIRSALNTKTIS